MRKGRSGARRRLLAGAAYAGWRCVAGAGARRSTATSVGVGAVPVPAGSAASTPRARRAAVVEPERRRSRARPQHPVKAKLASGIYHVPGGGNYERTKADRCYVDATRPLSDGLRAQQGLSRSSPEIDRAGGLHAGQLA